MDIAMESAGLQEMPPLLGEMLQVQGAQALAWNDLDPAPGADDAWLTAATDLGGWTALSHPVKGA